MQKITYNPFCPPVTFLRLMSSPTPFTCCQPNFIMKEPLLCPRNNCICNHCYMITLIWHMNTQFNLYIYQIPLLYLFILSLYGSIFLFLTHITKFNSDHNYRNYRCHDVGNRTCKKDSIDSREERQNQNQWNQENNLSC